MPFEFIEGATRADVAFEATGKTPEELFESCGRAVTKTMVGNAEVIENRESVEFSLNNETMEGLLHDFMDEIVYYKDAEMLLFCEYRLKVREEEGKFHVEAILGGEKIDQKKHDLVVDVKAVSWHKYEVQKTEEGWKSFAILDV